MDSYKNSVMWILLLATIGLANGQNPEIVNDILPDIQRVGFTAKLNCTVARLKTAKVQWSYLGKDGVPGYVISIDREIKTLNTILGGVPQYQVKRFNDGAGEERTTFQLVISRIRPEYSGTYQCLIIQPNIGYIHWTKKTGHLTVLYAPIIKPGSTTFVKLLQRGDTDSIHCDAHGVPAPNITWVRSDGQLLSTGKAIFRGKTLQIRKADVTHTGVYRCVADNQIRPPAQALVQVYVYQPPQVRVLQDSVGQFGNGRFEAKLDCIVQGYPTPTVNWGHFDGEKFRLLTNNDKYQTTKQVTDMQNLMNGEQWYTLRILNVQASDYKKYYCVAKNYEGSMNKTVTLFSTYDCQGPLCYSAQADNKNGNVTFYRLSPSTMFACFVVTVIMGTVGHV